MCAGIITAPHTCSVFREPSLCSHREPAHFRERANHLTRPCESCKLFICGFQRVGPVSWDGEYYTDFFKGQALLRALGAYFFEHAREPVRSVLGEGLQLPLQCARQRSGQGAQLFLRTSLVSEGGEGVIF